MEKIQNDKISEMLRSKDHEMQELGLLALLGEFRTWSNYMNYKRKVLEGKPLLPKHLRSKFRAMAEDLAIRRREFHEKSGNKEQDNNDDAR